ncbi:haloacid dehalogenase-like hydrolase [Luteimonas terrae]|uniref:Haloacid dehalogenase-like hydrolase n=1 Tax=Luteimonas terrae TaxID=1530191 RepID=A0ABU1XY76_9GAMM|nr:haloacid dehalogenase-like hydrolase [Luteimonas terrae]MDR7193729.1 hypothetical protein [Luteimonas terrae]
MTTAVRLSTHSRSPRAALSAIRDFDGPLLIDLDETLYLRNSTEDFIDCACPGLVAIVLLRVLDLLKPWRWTGGPATRDFWRVRTIGLLMPWTRGRWRRRAHRLAAEHANQPLIDTLNAHRSSAVIIITNGFAPIVGALVAGLGLSVHQVIAAGLSSARDRRIGKLRMAQEQLGDRIVGDALVLSDSLDDLPLLDACRRPLLTIWPGARFRSALARTYLPGQYLSQVKRPGERYIVRGILQEDFVFWVLASVGLAALPVLHVLGLGLLLLSFWTIYELGYVDNDRVAARYESDPKLSAAYHAAPVATPRVRPWIWALGSAALAITVLRWPAPPGIGDLAIWTGLLLALQLSFRFYNRLDKQTRIWPFAGLQLARAAAFAVLVPISPVGAMALGAHVLARWTPYLLYRIGGREWPDTRFHLVRLMFFGVLSGLLALAVGIAPLLDWTAAALLGWNLFRARKELLSMVNAASRIDRTPA